MPGVGRGTSGAASHAPVGRVWYGRRVAQEPVPAQPPQPTLSEPRRDASPDRPTRPIVIQPGAAVGVVAAVLVAIGGGAWAIIVRIDSKIDDTRRELTTRIDKVGEDVVGLRVEAGRQGGVLTQIDARVTRLEQKVGLGPEPSDLPDGGVVDAGSEDAGGWPSWNAEHVARRRAFCRPKCDDKQCQERCAAAYNACGIKCQSVPATKCFTDCVAEIRVKE